MNMLVIHILVIEIFLFILALLILALLVFGVVMLVKAIRKHHFFAKRKNRIICAIVASCMVIGIVSAVGINYLNNIPKNVFEEIYHDRVKNYSSCPMMKATKGFHFRYDWRDSLWRKSTYSNHKYCQTNYYWHGSASHSGKIEFITMYYYKKRKKIAFSHYWQYENSYTGEKEPWASYIYDGSSNTLAYATNAPEGTPQDMFLYDLILKDWIESNQGTTKYDMQNLGEFQDVGQVDATTVDEWVYPYATRKYTSFAVS